ncbi:MAG: tRNA-(ms[2]io[6]A)-hydroxylase [Deltaproteobacteria bacterium]|nr:tRNA-(ms[2]io[6]A)-hydroxylase [Deltaproteobacteria bacterium]
MSEIDLLPLTEATPPAWIEVVKENFDAFLLDHASCERKAAASALSLLARHADQPMLVETMVTLAREELDHFGQVHRIILKRGLTLLPDEKDPYVNQLLTVVRQQPAERLLDRLLVSALIEARSCERFLILSQAELPDADLSQFYRALYRSEAGHFRVFHRLAERIFGAAAVASRWPELCRFEGAVMRGAPLRPAVH